MCHDAKRPVRRGGLTLVEICLVLALLIVIGSIAIPLMSGTVDRRALSSGADIVRATWAKARMAAMQSGETYVVRLEPKGSRFQIMALDKLALPESQETPSEDPDAEHAAADMLRLPRNRLPDGVIFGQADVSNSNQLAATMGSATEGPWSTPILFRPDGTTSDASVVLIIESGQTTRVTLRGLTGSSSAGEIGREPVK